jgi:attractin
LGRGIDSWRAIKGRERGGKMAPELLIFMWRFRRKGRWWWTLGVLLLVWAAGVAAASGGGKCNTQCINGYCANGTCHCYDGWQGPNCQFCGGKVR